MINLVEINPSQEEMREMFIESFGEHENTFLSQHVFLVCEGDTEIAWCSGYPHSKGTLYLQYIGFRKGITKQYTYYKETVKALHEMGYPWIMGTIDNENVVAIMWALRSGFKIIGARQASDGKLYVEILRRASNDS